MASQTPPGEVYEEEATMGLIMWQYCRDPNDINEAILSHDEDWGLNDAKDIVSITYDPNQGCYVVFYHAKWDEVST